MLVAAIVGSGIAAQHLSPHQTGLELLENTLATAAALTAIILVIGPVSGAHLNPVITLVDRLFGGVSTRDAASYVAAQLAGGITGATAANVMFGDAAVSLSAHHRASGPHLFAEAVATFGLVLVVFGLARAGRAHLTPFAVGLYIAAAYWFTSSTSFANPAVTPRADVLEHVLRHRARIGRPVRRPRGRRWPSRRVVRCRSLPPGPPRRPKCRHPP